MSNIAQYIFNPTVVENDVQNIRFLSLLPSSYATDELTKFISSSVEHLFTPGDDVPLNGYIGSKPSWNNISTDYYISEPTATRQFYQLEPAMVSIDDNGNYQSTLTYPDFINNLGLQGAFTQNQARLFQEQFYTWCPSIDLDKFFNYQFYLWVSNTSSNETQTVPDYLVIDKNSLDKNPWSVNNNWIRREDYDASNYDYPTTTTAGQRPIIEFFPNIELYQYGIFRRLDVDLLWNDPSGITGINGKPSITIDGITVNEQYINDNGGAIRVLVTNDSNSSYNNRVYSIVFIDGALTLSVESDGQDPSGNPVVGEIIKILEGTNFGSTINLAKEFYWDGSTWSPAQAKLDVNQFPLFQLYDMNGTSLSDESSYPSSTFNGSKLFSYNVGTGTNDTVLGFPLTEDVYGQTQYQNYLSTETYSYIDNLISTVIEGYYFYNVYDSEGNNSFINDWYMSENLSKQYITDTFISDGINFIFQLSQEPLLLDNGLNDITVELITTDLDDNTGGNASSTLTQNVDFILNGDKILIPSASYNDQIVVNTYNNLQNPNDDAAGFYELPVNLTANPNNNGVTLVSLGDVFDQFVEVMTNQVGFTGNYTPVNNYRNTAKLPIYGTSIIQNEDNLLLTMLLCNSDSYNMVNSIIYAQSQYRTFRNKFEQKITEYYVKGTKSIYNDSVDTWTIDALEEVIRGKTSIFPFYNNGVAKNSTYEIDYFIPATPSYLGIYPIYEPSITVDTTNPNNPPIIQNHDGSITPCYGDFRDQVLLELETKIYNSIDSSFKLQERPICDYYVNKQLYTESEWNELLQPSFELWVTRNNLDYKTNTTYDSLNPLTWNWSNVISNIDGTLLPGGWRGIYKKYYNTDRPHTNPWEMLGFSVEPSWWSSYYGSAPYTNKNKMMWRDIQNGVIKEGTRTDNILYKYPYLLDYLPVDNQGYLLDPFKCGIAKNYPNQNDAYAEWEFGDSGPIESLWRRSSEYAFGVTIANYLSRPAHFINNTWSSINDITIMSGEKSQQIINKTLKRRAHYSDYILHNELVDNSYVCNIGVQQYVSDYLKSQSLDITTTLGDLIRGLDVRMVHKMAGFTDSSQMTVSSDSSDVIPQENYSISLYNSPNIREEYYSGVLIQRVATGYKIFGYDPLTSYFKIIAPDTSGPSTTITATATTRQKINSWEPELYYQSGNTVIYNNVYYMCITTHVSTYTFDVTKWSVVERPAITSIDSVSWYTAPNINKDVTKISYGTVFNTEQEVANFLNGYQIYLEEAGWQFDVITTDASGNDVNSNFAYSMQNIMYWINSAITVGSFLTVSPLSSQLTFNCDNGEISNIEVQSYGSYGLVDKYAANISPYSTDVIRSEGSVTVTVTDDVPDGIFGMRLYIYELEHLLVLDNETIFGDILYNPVFNIRQPRLKLTGFKTGDWTGRLSAPGFIIDGNTIVPNFERTADNFRHFFDIEYSDDNTLQERAWANTGFTETDYMTNLMLSPTNQFEFYKGSIQNKGCPVAFSRLMNSSFISNNKNIEFFEEWALRCGDYGGSNIDQDLIISIKQSDFVNNPQLISFNTNFGNDKRQYNFTYNIGGTNSQTINIDGTITGTIHIDDISVTVNPGSTGTFSISTSNKVIINDMNLAEINSYSIDLDNEDINVTQNELIIDYNGGNATVEVSINYTLNADNFSINTNIPNAININDVISSDTNLPIIKDDSWVWRLFGNEVDWKTTTYPMLVKSFLPNAGYVKKETVDWYVTNNDDFLDFFNTKKEVNPSTTLTSSDTFDLSTITGPNVITKNLISGNNTGYYRVNSIVYDVTLPFTLPVTIGIGRSDQLPNGSTNDYSSTEIARITSEDLQQTGTFTLYPSALWNLEDFADNTIKIQYAFNDIAYSAATESKDKDCYGAIIYKDPATTAIGKVSITINCEWITSSILPNERAWIYDTGYGNWDTRKLCYTGINVDNVSVPLTSTLASVVTIPQSQSGQFDGILQDILPEDQLLILDGVEGEDPELQSMYYPRYEGSVTVALTPSSSSVPIIKMMTDAGMNLTGLNVNITQPFTSASGQTVGLDVGTEDNPTLMAQSSMVSNPTPAQPSFSVAVPVTVNIPNTSITALDTASVINVDVIRSGNIFGIPNTCSDLPVTSVTWQAYPCDSSGWPTVATADGDIVTFQLGTGVQSSMANPSDETNPSGIKNIIASGTIVFGTPDSTTDVRTTYWDQIISLVNVTTYDYIRVDLLTAENAVIGPNNYTVIGILDSSQYQSYDYIDPTTAGSYNVPVGLFNINNSNDVITASVSNAASGSADITVTYTYKNGFEIFDSNLNPVQLDTEGYGGNIFNWKETRFASIADRDNQIVKNNYFIEGDYIEIDSINSNGDWGIYQYENNSWNLLYSRTPKIDSSYIEKAVVYNNSSGTVEETLEVWDPYKGYIPTSIRSQIDYIQEYDPAKYNSSTDYSLSDTAENYWAADQIGNLWWDVSTTKYLDYENFDLNYKIDNWGALLPGITVNIYEWVRSPVLPSSWNDYVASDSPVIGYDQNPSGTITDTIGLEWVELPEYNQYTNKVQSSYYFWVINTTTIPNGCNRLMSGTGVATALQNPSSNGISYISVIDTNKVLIGGTKQYLDDENCVLKIQWKTMDKTINYHKEWELVRNGDTSQTISSTMWNKMVDCLVGWDDNSISYDIVTKSITDIPMGDSVSFQIENNINNFKNIPYYGDVKIGANWFTYTSIVGNVLYGISNNIKEFPSGTAVEFIFTNDSPNMVPDPNLTSYEANGTLVRPRQSWFPPESSGAASRYARKLFVQEFNNLMAEAPVLDQWSGWQSVFDIGEAQPIESAYSYVSTNMVYRDQLVENGIISIGESVLVTGLSSSADFWLLYTYLPYHMNADSVGYVLTEAQKWRMQDGELWSSVDWYADGYSIEDYPLYTFDTKADMMASQSTIDLTLLNGTLVKINTQDASDTRWSWLIYNEDGWTEVAKQSSTIQLSDQFWTSDVLYGLTDYNLSDISSRDGTNELRYMLTQLYSSLLDESQKNDIFFTMLKGSVSLNQEIDWAFKTSFMFLGGYTEQLKQTPVAFVNQLDNIISYINSVKPYHVTIRDYINAVTVGPDIGNFYVTDFDFPAYNDTSITSGYQYRQLNPQVQSPLNYNEEGNASDTQYVINNRPWSDWYENYLNTNTDPFNWDSNWNPVRKKIITMKFNRIDFDTPFSGTEIDPQPMNSETYNANVYDKNTYIDFTIQDTNPINDEEYDPAGILVDGNNFIQPYWDAGHPDEGVPTKVQDPFVMTFTTEDDTTKAVSQKFLLSKDAINSWEYIDLSNDNYTVDTDNETSITLDVTGTFGLHDPANPSTEFLDKVKLNYVEVGYTQEQINSMLGRMFPGVIYINNEKIVYWNVTKNSDTSYTISGLIRNCNGLTSRLGSPYNLVTSFPTHKSGDVVCDASVVSWMTPNNQIMWDKKLEHPDVTYKMSSDGTTWTLGNLNIANVADINEIQSKRS